MIGATDETNPAVVGGDGACVVGTATGSDTALPAAGDPVPPPPVSRSVPAEQALTATTATATAASLRVRAVRWLRLGVPATSP